MSELRLNQDSMTNKLLSAAVRSTLGTSQSTRTDCGAECRGIDLNAVVDCDGVYSDYELYIGAISHFTIEAIFARKGRQALVEAHRTGGISAIQDAIEKLTTRNATATQAAYEKVHAIAPVMPAIDQMVQAIRDIIMQLPQGFETLDRVVKEKLATLILQTLANEVASCEDQPQKISLKQRFVSSVASTQMDALKKANDLLRVEGVAQQQEIATQQQENATQQQEIELLRQEIAHLQRKREAATTEGKHNPSGSKRSKHERF